MLTAIVALMGQLVTWERVQPPILHQGTWQSCNHEERVLEHRVNGALKWELHLGPDDEFGLYRVQTDDPHQHSDALNLLKPYTVKGKAQQWTVRRLHLQVSVSKGGGSREECEAFYVSVKTVQY